MAGPVPLSRKTSSAPRACVLDVGPVCFAMNNRHRKGILRAVNSKIRLIALFALIAESCFLGSLPFLEPEGRVLALVVAAMVLSFIVLIGAFVVLSGPEVSDVNEDDEDDDDVA